MASDYLEEIILAAADALDSGRNLSFGGHQRFDPVDGVSHSNEHWEDMKAIDALLETVGAENAA